MGKLQAGNKSLWKTMYLRGDETHGFPENDLDKFTDS